MSGIETVQVRVPRTRRQSSGLFRWLSRTLGWVTVIVLIAVWQIAATISKSVSVASFTEAVAALGRLLTGKVLLDDVLPSVERIILSFVIAGVAGIVLGLVIGLGRTLDTWIQPVLEFGRAVPPPLLIPIALLVFGLGPQLIVSVTVFGAFWPVLLNTIDGARRVEPLYIDVARSLHHGRIRRVVSVVIPAALPMIMAGLRVALSTSFILIVLSEMLASANGLGFQLVLAQQTFDIPTTYAGVILLAILGLIFDTFFVLIERKVLSGLPGFQGGDGV